MESVAGVPAGRFSRGWLRTRQTGVEGCSGRCMGGGGSAGRASPATRRAIPSVVGRCLGLMHRCARTYALHSIACASMELRPRPSRNNCGRTATSACAKLAASDIGAEYAKLVETCVEINQCVGCTDDSSLSHFSAMTWPRWLRRAVRNRHRHAIEQASRRWRGGRRDDSARTRRKILISTQVETNVPLILRDLAPQWVHAKLHAILMPPARQDIKNTRR